MLIQRSILFGFSSIFFYTFPTCSWQYLSSQSKGKGKDSTKWKGFGSRPERDPHQGPIMWLLLSHRPQIPATSDVTSPFCCFCLALVSDLLPVICCPQLLVSSALSLVPTLLSLSSLYGWSEKSVTCLFIISGNPEYVIKKQRSRLFFIH